MNIWNQPKSDPIKDIMDLCAKIDNQRTSYVFNERQYEFLYKHVLKKPLPPRIRGNEFSFKFFADPFECKW